MIRKSQTEPENVLQLFRANDEKLTHTINHCYRFNFIKSMMNRYRNKCEACEADLQYSLAIENFSSVVQKDKNFTLRCRLETILYTYGKNALINYLKRKDRLIAFDDQAINEPTGGCIFEESDTADFAVKVIKILLKKLSRTDRKIIRYFCLKHYRWKEIAKKMRLKAGYLRKRKSLIFTKWREMGLGRVI